MPRAKSNPDPLMAADLTMRDVFALVAAHAMISRGAATLDDIAEHSYYFADYMVAERMPKPETDKEETPDDPS